MLIIPWVAVAYWVVVALFFLGLGGFAGYKIHDKQVEKERELFSDSESEEEYSESESEEEDENPGIRC